MIIFCLVMIAFGSFAFSQISNLDTSSSKLQRHYSKLQDLIALEEDSQDSSNIVRSYLLTQNPEYQTQYNQISVNLDATLQSLTSQHLNASESKIIADYQTTSNRLQGTELLILADTKEGQTNSALMLFNLNYELQESHATSLITNLVSQESQIVSSLFYQNSESIDTAQEYLFIAIAVTVLIAIVFVSLISFYITYSVRNLMDAARRFSKGNFSARIKVQPNGRDEFNQLAEIFNTMAVELNNTLRSEAERAEELSAEKARFLSSIDSLPIGFMMTDDSNVVLNINPALQRMMGIKKITSEVEAKTQIKSNDKFLVRLLNFSKKALDTREPISIHEMSNQGKLYRSFFTPVLVANDKSDDAIGAAILVEDVTEERVLARSKDEFFSIASHELRTPLTAIRGNTGLIKQFYKKELQDKDLNEMIDDIQDSSIRLIEIVNDFLDASRLEQGKMQFNSEIFPVENIIESVIYEMGATIKEKNIYLHMTNDLGSLPEVNADKNKVKQIIYNLVGNAVKFTDKGGITVSAKVVGKFLELSVSDSGKGMSPKNQQILFHKFQQASSSILTRDTTRGTGMGLYISKLLTEKMGGKIELAHSEEGKGSTFVFTLPLARQPKPE
jgi:signal transduction histidine kinase/HAMP domain-containing protein